MIWLYVSAWLVMAFVIGYCVGYRFKSHEAHELARRRRLNRVVAAGQAAQADLHEMPPRQSTADVRRTRH